MQIAIRTQTSTLPLEVRDLSVVGMGLTGPRPLPVALGERVYLLIDWAGEPMIRGALVRARVRRRRPDRDGWFLGVEIDDLRMTPWSHLATWVHSAAARQGVQPLPQIRSRVAYNHYFGQLSPGSTT